MGLALGRWRWRRKEVEGLLHRLMAHGRKRVRLRRNHRQAAVSRRLGFERRLTARTADSCGWPGASECSLCSWLGHLAGRRTSSIGTGRRFDTPVLAIAGPSDAVPAEEGPKTEDLGLEGEQKALALAVAHREVSDESLVGHALTLADGVGVGKRGLRLSEIGLERGHLGHLRLERREMERPALAERGMR
jgi:hypothetical protein